MFDFEKLVVYQKSLGFAKEILSWLVECKGVDDVLSKQLKRSATSILFNLAEGTGRSAVSDKKHFYTIARGSVYEVVATIQLLHNLGLMENGRYQKYYDTLVEISKMLLALIRACK